MNTAQVVGSRNNRNTKIYLQDRGVITCSEGGDVLEKDSRVQRKEKKQQQRRKSGLAILDSVIQAPATAEVVRFLLDLLSNS